MNNKHLVLLAGLVTVSGFSARANVVNYNNTVASPAYINSWGTGETYTYGETFVAPGTGPLTALDDFTFYLKAENALGVTTYFQANVYAWTGDLVGVDAGHAIGAPIFSQNSSITGDGSLQAVTFTPGGSAVLNTGGDYVAYFTVSDPASLAANGTNGTAFEWALGAGGLYGHSSYDGGGSFEFYNNATADQLTSNTWETFTDFGSLAWNADFDYTPAPTPEPGTLALAALGLAGLVGARRRK